MRQSAKGLTVDRRKLLPTPAQTAPQHPEGTPYLRQLQHNRVIHVELSWNRLDEVSAAHGDDAKASAQCFQLLDGSDQVVSGVRKSTLKTLGRSARHSDT